MQLHHWTFTLALVLLGLELLSPTFFFAGLAVGVAFVGALHFLTGELHLARDLLVLTLAAAGAFFAFRHFFRKPDDVAPSDSDINQY